MLNSKEFLNSDDSKEILNSDDLAPAWNVICDKLGTAGYDFNILSLRPRKGEKRWFHASSYIGQGRARGQKRVRLQKAYNPKLNSRLSKPDSFGLPEFEIVAKHYNNYLNEVSSDIRQTDSHKSSYIVTLIANLLE